MKILSWYTNPFQYCFGIEYTKTIKYLYPTNIEQREIIGINN